MAVLLRRRTASPLAVPLRRTTQPAGRIRALRASAWRIDPGNRDQASLVRAVRQPWQATAWRHRKTIGPLRYGCVFLRNIASRMVLFPAAHVPDQLLPVPVEDSDLARHTAVCHDALDRLGDHSPLLASTMDSFEVAGECFLVSRIDRGDGVEREVWEIRSTSEIGVSENGKVIIRESPGSGGAPGTGGSDTYELQDDDFFSRLWVPDPEWRRLADSPVHAAEPILEELTLLLAERRSTTVSRLATNGMLLLPDTLSAVRMSGEESADDEDDPWLAMLAEAAQTAIQHPGSAAAAIPIVARGPVEALKEVRLLTLDRPTADNPEKWKEALSALAVTIDLPPETLLGIGDVNHWSGWVINQSVFSNHAEPLVQLETDAFTAGYYRRYLVEAGMPPEDAARLLVWYDPSEAIAKPDMSQAAQVAFENDALSWEALRRHLGFTEDEAPDEQELVTHLLLRSKQLDPAIAEQLIRLLDPRLKPPPPVVVAPPAPGPGGQPADGPPEEGPPPADSSPESGSPPGMRARVAELRARRLAAGHPAEMRARVAAYRARRLPVSPPVEPDRRLEVAARISRRMAERDARLRETLRMAAEQAVKRVLERAGAKVLTRARQKDSLAAAACREMPTWSVPARLGRTVVAALGLAEDQLIDAELAELAGLWDRYVGEGQTQALRDAARLAGLDVSVAFAQLDGKLRNDRAAGWAFLRGALDRRVRDALAVDPTEAVATASLVPTSAVRAALAIAGGMITPLSQGINGDTLLPVDSTEWFGQIGTGTTVRGYLETNSGTVEEYVWVHGMSINPFPPHEALDGYAFTGWDDAGLSSDSFVGDLHPGDHAGCFTAGTTVSGPPVIATFARHYEGAGVEIVTHAGKKLTATANHPVLTDQGWVAAGCLNVGSRLVCRADGQGANGRRPDDQQRPARIEDVAGAHPVAGSMAAVTVPVAAEDFHGDGRGSDVAVVWADGLLRDQVRDVTGFELVEQPVLLRESLHRFAGEVALDKVTGLRLVELSEHVYNLSTIDGWYLAEGVVVHNCNCDVQLIWSVAEQPAEEVVGQAAEA